MEYNIFINIIEIQPMYNNNWEEQGWLLDYKPDEN